MEKEEWRDIPNYEGYYQVSNFGGVRSSDRTVEFSDGRKTFYKGRVIKGNVHKKGYRQTALSINGVISTFTFSQLVAMAFLGHEPNGNTLVVDHINGDRSNDRVENLRIVTNRANITTCFRSDRGLLSSKYVGVSWSKANSKWVAQILFKGAVINLGYFDDELEASSVYQLALIKIKGNSFNPDSYKPKFASKHKGVCFHKASGRWMAQIKIKGRQKYIGLFHTEAEAHQAYQSKLKELNNKKTYERR